MEASNSFPFLDSCRYSGYLFEKNAYPDVLDTCSKKNTYPYIKSFYSALAEVNSALINF